MRQKKEQYLALVGCGDMAQEYAKVLNSLGVRFTVFGRGNESKLIFEKKTGITASKISIEDFIGINGIPSSAIICVSVEQLASLTKKLLKIGVTKILVEKPGGISKQEIKKITTLSQTKNATVVIGFNRRFYASVMAAKRIIKSDGGITSCTFQFTEWMHLILNKYPKILADKWLLSNPIHVLDLFLYLCGKPAKINSTIMGDRSWHPSGLIFTGSGYTTQNIPFSYHADWSSSGRWGIEIYTPKRKLILSPLEKLVQIKKGSTKVEDVKIEDALDIIYKPGLYKQVKAFIDEKYESFCTVGQQLDNFYIYYKIAGYK
jgi:predicted dehydrogenase